MDLPYVSQWSRKRVISLATEKYPNAIALIKTKKNMAMMNLKVRLTRKWKKDLENIFIPKG